MLLIRIELLFLNMQIIAEKLSQGQPDFRQGP